MVILWDRCSSKKFVIKSIINIIVFGNSKDRNEIDKLQINLESSHLYFALILETLIHYLPSIIEIKRTKVQFSWAPR